MVSSNKSIPTFTIDLQCVPAGIPSHLAYRAHTPDGVLPTSMERVPQAHETDDWRSSAYSQWQPNPSSRSFADNDLYQHPAVVIRPPRTLAESCGKTTQFDTLPQPMAAGPRAKPLGPPPFKTSPDRVPGAPRAPHVPFQAAPPPRGAPPSHPRGVSQPRLQQPPARLPTRPMQHAMQDRPLPPPVARPPATVAPRPIPRGPVVPSVMVEPSMPMPVPVPVPARPDDASRSLAPPPLNFRPTPKNGVHFTNEVMTQRQMRELALSTFADRTENLESGPVPTATGEVLNLFRKLRSVLPKSDAAKRQEAQSIAAWLRNVGLVGLNEDGQDIVLRHFANDSKKLDKRGIRGQFPQMNDTQVARLTELLTKRFKYQPLIDFIDEIESLTQNVGEVMHPPKLPYT